MSTAPKLYALKPEQCVNIPKPMVPGVLYVSMAYALAIHLCPCGCGVEAVTPLAMNHTNDRDGWQLEGTDDCVTLNPSILNRAACASHYFIRDNNVEWC